jgi:hypothetical protein
VVSLLLGSKTISPGPKALPAIEENVFGTFLHYQKGTRRVGGGTPTNSFKEQIWFCKKDF